MSAEHPDDAALTSLTTLPDPDDLLRGTAWDCHDSAIGDYSIWLPYVLRALLDPDPEIQSGAFADLEPIRHQNTIYGATVPAAIYIAGILPDPRTATLFMFGDYRWSRDHQAPLRSALIRWLGSVVDDASWQANTPEGAAVLARRPVFFNAIAPFLHDDDDTIRRAAIEAAAVLVEAPELASHRPEITKLNGSEECGDTRPSAATVSPYVDGSFNGDPWAYDPWTKRD